MNSDSYTKRGLISEESSEFNSIFLINNDLSDLLDFDRETSKKTPIILSHSLLAKPNDDHQIKQIANLNFSSIEPCHKSLPTFSQAKILPKKHNNYVNDYLINSNIFPAAHVRENQNVLNLKETEKFSYNHSPRYELIDSNDLLKSLRKALQIKQKNSKVKTTVTSFIDEPNLKTPKISAKTSNDNEKTQEETNFEKYVKDSLTFSNPETTKDEKFLFENSEKNEIDGLDIFFETRTQTLSQIKLPINQKFLSKKNQNEILWNNCFDFETQNKCFFLIIKLKIEKDVQNPLQINVNNATEGIKTKSLYDWQFAGIVSEKVLFNGVLISALDKISGLNYNVLMLDYEKLSLLQLYEDLYRVLMLYSLNYGSHKQNTIIKIFDIYVTEYLDLLQTGSKYILWVVFEPFDLQMANIITMRKDKNMLYSGAELFYVYKKFVSDLIQINQKYGVCYSFAESSIFYSSLENCFKIIDISFLFQIKNKLPHAVTTLNNLIEKMKIITDFDEEYRLEAYMKNLHIRLDKVMDEIVDLTPVSKINRNQEGVLEQFLSETKNNERNIDSELKIHATILTKCYCYKFSNEKYKKLLVKLEMNGENDFEIKYKIGKNFFRIGAFDKAKALLALIKENWIKNMDIYYKKILIIIMIFALVSISEGDLEAAVKYFDEILNVLKKYEGKLPALKQTILKYLGFVNSNLAYNLSHLKKALKIYNDALILGNTDNGKNNNDNEDNDDILNSLGIINAKLGNYEKSLLYFKEIDYDLNNDATSSSNEQITIEKKIILLSNQSLMNIETTNYIEAKTLLDQTRNLCETNKTKEILKIKLNLYYGVYYDQINNFYDALKEFKSACLNFKKAFPIRKNLNNDLKKILFAIFNGIAGVYLKSGDFEKTQAYLIKSEKLLNEFDPLREKISAGFLAHNQGLFMKSVGRMDESIKLFENSLKIKRKFFEEKHSYIINTMKLLMNLYLAHNNNEKAFEYSEKLIEIWKQAHAKNPKELLNLLEETAEVFEKYNNSLEATKIYNTACSFINNEQITDSKRIVIFVKLSNLYETNKNWDKNIEIIEKLIEIHSKNKEENMKVLMDLVGKMIENCKKNKKDELLKKYLIEMESLRVIQNSQILLKKVGGKLLVSFKGAKSPQKVNPFSNK